MIGSRCFQSDGLELQPGGVSGPVIAATAEVPGSGRVPTASPNAKAPTSVSERKAAGLVVQNRNGTAMIPAATTADAQRAPAMRQDSDSVANRSRPEEQRGGKESVSTSSYRWSP